MYTHAVEGPRTRRGHHKELPSGLIFGTISALLVAGGVFWVKLVLPEESRTVRVIRMD